MKIGAESMFQVLSLNARSKLHLVEIKTVQYGESGIQDATESWLKYIVKLSALTVLRFNFFVIHLIKLNYNP
jgi:hypothetical protein